MEGCVRKLGELESLPGVTVIEAPEVEWRWSPEDDEDVREIWLCSSIARLCTRCSQPASFVSHCGFGILRGLGSKRVLQETDS